jgi:hypothetical protein
MNLEFGMYSQREYLIIVKYGPMRVFARHSFLIECAMHPLPGVSESL